MSFTLNEPMPSFGGVTNERTTLQGERSRKPGDVDGRPLYRVPSGSGVRYFLGQPEQLVTKKTTTKSHHCKSICTLSRGLSWIMNWNIKNAQTASDVPFIFYAVESSNKAQTQFAEIVGNGKTYETGILFQTLI